MAQAWEDMKLELEQGKFEIVDIESQEEAAKIAEFKEKYGIELTSKGYPTIFKIVDGKQINYDGDRDLNSLLLWANGS
jgi:hypothetical protein